MKMNSKTKKLTMYLHVLFLNLIFNIKNNYAALMGANNLKISTFEKKISSNFMIKMHVYHIRM